MGEVCWEFTEEGCEPTSEEHDPPYCYWPQIANPTFGTRYADGGPVWTWADGVYTVNNEDVLNYAIPERGEQTYLRQYFEVVHTIVESEDPSLIGLGLELWNMGDWPGCPTNFEDTGEYLEGYEFPAPTSSVNISGDWYKSIWVADFSTDGAVWSFGEEGRQFSDLYEATHTTAIIGMADFGATGFQMDEVHIMMVWYSDLGGGTYPDWLEQCSCLGIIIPPPPPEPPIEFDPNFTFLCEPQDVGGPPPQCPINGTVGVRLSWRPGEDQGYPPFMVKVTVNPDPNNEVTPNPDLILPASTEPNGVVRLTFNQTNWNVWQNVVFEAVKDLEREGNESYLVRFSTETSVDPNFDGYETLRGSIVVDNDIPYISVLPRWYLEDVLSENDPCVPRCVNITLSHQPTDNVEVLVTRESEFDVLLESMSVMDPNHLLFAPGNYNVNQQICLEARDDEELAESWLEWITGTIILNGSSVDIRYQSIDEGGELEPTEVDFNVQDNDCGAWGYDHRDVNHDCYVNLGDFAMFYTQWLFCTVKDGRSVPSGVAIFVDCDALWNF
jgi:hypothetical protein